MTQTDRFWKFVFASIAGIILMAGGILIFIWFQLTPDQEQLMRVLGQENSFPLIMLGFLVFGSLWILFDITYHTYIRPLKRLSAEAGVIYSSNPSHRIKIKGSKDILTLCRIINDFADMFENLNKTITEQILAARTETEKERNLLAAIMAELPQGVIICNKSGRILFFNSLAKKIFSSQKSAHGTEHFIGLGRSIFNLLDKQLVAHAVNEISEQLNNRKKSVGSFFITPIYTGNLISVEAIPILDQNSAMTGFILAFQDISPDINRYETIDTQLSEFQTMLENKPPATNFKNLVERYRTLAGVIRDLSFSRLPLTTLNLKNFLGTLQKKAAHECDIRINIFNDHWDTRILADAYSLTRAFVFLFQNLSRLCSQTEFNLKISHSETLIGFEISWDDTVCRLMDMEKLLHQKINALPGFSYVLQFNNARIHFVSLDRITCSGIRIHTKAGKKFLSSPKHRSPVMAGSRPEFYDFDLFSLKTQERSLLETALKEITYTVFDTETTGLNPDGGDEIVSIGAVRIVNNRIVYQDVFEELVNPKRDIPIESYRIHGINHEMVMEMETIERVLPRFKQFTSASVLVGHNIAFDMKMLELKEKTTGIQFKNPTLDTLLLSAVLHPAHEQHDIESIAKRLGVSIIGRHTALGDAITTAEIFKKLIPILNSNGILTLKDALKASQKTYYARLKY